MDEVVDGVRPAVLAAWMRERELVDGPVHVARISGGHSNLTFRVSDDAGSVWALRRPPTGGVLATAHDMSREWRFISTLAPTPVPVPDPVAYCDDADVIGAEFYLMGFVDGVVPGDPESGERIPQDIRRSCGLDVADVLAELHAVDPDEVGLGDLHRPGSYLERQLRRWHRQVHESAIEDLSAVDEAHRLLTERMPATGETRIAHGDYRPGNLSFGADGRIAAIFDWELATLGEPLADLGWVLASWARPDDTQRAITTGPTAADGWPERDEVAQRYAERSGRDLSELPYFLAFARWRSACIGAGVYTRYKRGNMGSGAQVGPELEQRAEQVVTEAEAALAALA
ncbi:aminoglycoside phosphotransferase (APT) family kinase protein [Pseudonocardia endophytica]|uniref:Aminoglycoside phosphotransferase (APT) family kinase protein n=2 Tax=Pseudonocardia endophytica TaxID=401976 RepID=A0A4R1HWH4_PSEEN|nr:aminoglycoside phosphotransferase (APT) family kinase protein [Pseudonocardia endophytica]